MLVTKHINEQKVMETKEKEYDDGMIMLWMSKIKWRLWKEYQKDCGKEPFLVTKEKHNQQFTFLKRQQMNQIFQTINMFTSKCVGIIDEKSVLSDLQ